MRPRAISSPPPPPPPTPPPPARQVKDREFLSSITVSITVLTTALIWPAAWGIKRPPARRQVKDREEPTVLYDGPIRDLCPLAPSNVRPPPPLPAVQWTEARSRARTSHPLRPFPAARQRTKTRTHCPREGFSLFLGVHTEARGALMR
jgi:hypothetical protein